MSESAMSLELSANDTASLLVTYNVGAEEIVVTTKEKMYRPIREYGDAWEKQCSTKERIRDFWAMAGVLATVITPLATVKFEDGVLPAWTIEFLFVGIAAVMLWTLTGALINYKRSTSNISIPSIDDVIHKIKGASQESGSAEGSGAGRK